MKNLSDIRQELDQVDREIVSLFEARMDLCRQVAEYKIAAGMPVLDSSREDQVLDSRAAYLKKAEYEPYVRDLYREFMRLSRSLQQKMIDEER